MYLEIPFISNIGASSNDSILNSAYRRYLPVTASCSVTAVLVDVPALTSLSLFDDFRAEMC